MFATVYSIYRPAALRAVLLPVWVGISRAGNIIRAVLLSIAIFLVLIVLGESIVYIIYLI